MATNWAGQAAAYEESFGKLCAGAVPFVLAEVDAIPRDTRVLDVGAGTGTLTQAFAEHGFARVQGSDADADMVEFAAQAHPSLQFTVDSLPNLPFTEGEFGLVTANFVVNHALKPREHVRELRRVTAAGGHVLVTIWPSQPTAAINALWGQVVKESQAVPLTGHRLPAEDDFDRSVPGLAELLSEADFHDVRTKEFTWDFVVEAERLWAGVAAGIGNIGATYLKQDESRRAAMRAAFEELTGLGDLTFPAVAVLGIGAVRV